MCVCMCVFVRACVTERERPLSELLVGFHPYWSIVEEDKDSKLCLGWSGNTILSLHKPSNHDSVLLLQLY